MPKLPKRKVRSTKDLPGPKPTPVADDTKTSIPERTYLVIGTPNPSHMHAKDIVDIISPLHAASQLCACKGYGYRLVADHNHPAREWTEPCNNYACSMGELARQMQRIRSTMRQAAVRSGNFRPPAARW